MNSITNNPTNQLLIFGLGYAASAVAKEVKQDFAISATHRSATKNMNDEYQQLIFDGQKVDADTLKAISSATHILVSIGPNEQGDPVLNAAKNLLTKATNLRWVGYFSTVGVYGNHDGEWVDEETICKPVSKRSIERVAAENQWQALAKEKEIPLAIFRLSGIYGPGRNALKNIEKGISRRLVKKNQVFNRIHRADIAQALAKALAVDAGGIFNITDDEPAPPQDVVTYVHRLRGSKPPPEIDFDTADLTPMARSFYGENKRVSNAKSKAVLGMSYLWPNYRKAFDAMWEDDSWQ